MGKGDSVTLTATHNFEQVYINIKNYDLSFKPKISLFILKVRDFLPAMSRPIYFLHLTS